jgi:methenyltetrahydrofolate cyclohydrolase
VKEFDVWLKDMSTKPVPGGVAAAAVAAAMGAALIAKAVRVTLRRQAGAEAERTGLHAALDLAHKQAATLLDLASADEQAYRAVLDLRQQIPASSQGHQTWQAATEVPIRVAEACRLLLARLPWLAGICWPAVYPDLKTGGWLLEAGMRAGLISAECNLRACGDTTQARSLHARIDGLKKDERDD